LHEARGAHQSLGWSHLVRHGMAAWMEAVTRTPSPTVALPYTRNSEATVSWPSDAMVTVLAGMVRGCFMEVA